MALRRKVTTIVVVIAALAVSLSLIPKVGVVFSGSTAEDNVRITMFSSLVVDLAREVGADFIVKGLRVVSDFESELMMAQMNKRVSGVDTLFIPSGSSHAYLASKLIREIARYGGDISSMVPASVAKRLGERYTQKGTEGEG